MKYVLLFTAFLIGSPATYGADWRETFRLTDGTKITHTRHSIKFDGCKMDDGTELKMTARKYNSMKTRFYDESIPETVLLDLKIKTTRDEFVQSLLASGLYIEAQPTKATNINTNQKEKTFPDDFKGNWRETFRLTDRTKITHTPRGVKFNGIYMDGDRTGLKMTERKYNSMKTRFYDESIPETILLDLLTNSTREEFIHALTASGLYKG